MRIKRLELKNFRGFEQAAVDFPEGNVVVFFGENGSGKTSMLDALAKMLYTSLTRIGDKGSLRIFNKLDFESNDIMVGLTDFKISMKYSIDETENDGTVILFNYQSTNEVDSDLFSGLNQHNEFEESLFDTIEDAIKSNQPIPVLAFYKTNREMQVSKKSDEIRNSNPLNRLEAYRDSFTARTEDYSNFEEWFRYQEDFENQEKIGKKDLGYINPQLDAVRKAVTNFIRPLSNISGDLRVKRLTYLNSAYTPNKEFSLVTTKNNQELQLSQLSSGERALILLVADIARRAVIANPQMPDPLQSSGIVLIDEIELHLHPKWQRRVIPALQTTFPNIQFIIATHSPQVLSNVPNGSVFEIENFQIIPRNTYGRDNRWILEAIMDDEPRPQEIQDMLDQYFAFIRNGELDRAEALRTKLESLIGRDEPLFRKADILTSRKERSIAT